MAMATLGRSDVISLAPPLKPGACKLSGWKSTAQPLASKALESGSCRLSMLIRSVEGTDTRPPAVTFKYPAMAETSMPRSISYFGPSLTTPEMENPCDCHLKRGIDVKTGRVVVSLTWSLTRARGLNGRRTAMSNDVSLTCPLWALRGVWKPKAPDVEQFLQGMVTPAPPSWSCHRVGVKRGRHFLQRA